VESDLLIGLGSIVVLGTAAQWIAWRLHLPSILLLLLVGFVAGPITGFIDPDALLGDLLFPIVSLAVGVILFEGGLSLNVRALREDGLTIGNMILIGGLITWAVAAAAAHWLLGFDLGLSLLMGAILIVTGPTVIIPMLLYIRPIGRVGSIVKWEGIVNDPFGAILAVLVFELLASGLGLHFSWHAAFGLFKAFAFGTLIGALGAGLIVLVLRRFWLPDLLQEPVTLMTAVGVFIAANLVQHEAGLLATTVMGIVLANQKQVSVKHIIEFKERVRVLLIAGLFVFLAARLQMENLAYIGLGSFAFLAVLVLVARPLAVFVSTLGSRLSWQERAFISWMAPRGIVAAAVSSVFGLYLADKGYPGAERLMPEIFFIIVGTVVLYGLTAGPLAKRLGLAAPTPQGLLLVSAHKWARELAKAVQREGFDVMLADTNWDNVVAAKMEGLTAFHENAVTSQKLIDEVAMHSIGRILALTPNDEANSLAALRFGEVFGRSNVFQLAPHSAGERRSAGEKHLRGRLLFDKLANFGTMSERCAVQGRIKAVNITDKFTYKTFRERYPKAVPLFLITEERQLFPFTLEKKLSPRSGQRIVALVDEENGVYIK